MKKSDKVLLKDLIIPKGTVFTQAPDKIEHYGDGHFEAVFGLSKDSYGTIYYNIDNENELSDWFTDLK
uniref:Uncharacterized protein n=1 Tax=viral metagenome TaxID=1070528 RepID=A0A6M3JVB7_9ZZZZ